LTENGLGLDLKLVVMRDGGKKGKDFHSRSWRGSIL
jgi:hypothetical protein